MLHWPKRRCGPVTPRLLRGGGRGICEEPSTRPAAVRPSSSRSFQIVFQSSCAGSQAGGSVDRWHLLTRTGQSRCYCHPGRNSDCPQNHEMEVLFLVHRMTILMFLKYLFCLLRNICVFCPFFPWELCVCTRVYVFCIFQLYVY